MSVFVRLDDICKTYPLEAGGRAVFALSHVSLTINRGEYVAIVGQSGSGKSTLMNLLGCLDVPTSGQVFLSDQIVPAGGASSPEPHSSNPRSTGQLSEKELTLLRNRAIGFVFQSFNLIPTLSALENVELPLLYRGLPFKERRLCSTKALKLVGLEDRQEHFPSQMSGGQQQRVAVARAIAASPSLILADEPTGNLDQAAAGEMISIFRSLHREGKTVVLITHDKEIAREADRVIRIEGGRVVSDV